MLNIDWIKIRLYIMTNGISKGLVEIKKAGVLHTRLFAKKGVIL
jgi:hypothetical protein